MLFPSGWFADVIAKRLTLLESSATPEARSRARCASGIITPMNGQLNDLYFGLYGYGKVLTDAGLFAVRDDERGFHYIPTDHLWSVFGGHPALDNVLFALHELVLGVAHEHMDFRTGKARQKWAAQELRILGASDEAVTRLKLLLKPHITTEAVGLVTSERI
jgi:hypothetical protein